MTPIAWVKIRLDNTSLEELRSQLDEVEEKVPTQRVLAAIGRKLGSSTEELAELHDVSGDTIRNWLNRFKQQPIEQAPYDDARSGRPPKLSDEEKEEFIADLHESPEEFGYDRQVWFPLLGGRAEWLARLYRLISDSGGSIGTLSEMRQGQ